ncbi:MAG: peptidylprolyl isomerase [Desulfobacterota bacterium]|jgi:peptidyl-prolyl cis-trans isomerase SurA|nr:peptidylprolyl isomerase [Thermodesulfobacteriota bacterium]
MRVFGRLFFMILMVSLWLEPPAGAEICNRVVAVVNNDVITLYELNNRIREMTGQAPEELIQKNEPMYRDAEKKILELLIDEKIAQAKIKELRIQVSDRQVDNFLDKLKRDNQWTQEDLVAGLEKEGLSYEKYRERVRKDIERAQLIEYEVRSKIIIRDEAVQKYYEDHKGTFGVAEKVQLAGIFLMRKNMKSDEEMRELYRKAQEITAKLKEGADFSQMAMTYSEGPGAKQGGDLGQFTVDHLEAGLKNLVEALPEGGVSDPLIRPNGIQIIKVVKKQTGKIRSLEEMKDAIYDILYREEVNRRYQAWIKELRDGAYTRVMN